MPSSVQLFYKFTTAEEPGPNQGAPVIIISKLQGEEKEFKRSAIVSVKQIQPSWPFEVQLNCALLLEPWLLKNDLDASHNIFLVAHLQKEFHRVRFEMTTGRTVSIHYGGELLQSFYLTDTLDIEYLRELLRDYILGQFQYTRD